MDAKRQALSFVDTIADRICKLSDTIWDNPELAFCEYKSAALQIEALKEFGFTVTENLAGIKTAFSGSFGSGRPVIAILGEFDALGGLSQKPGVTKRSPLVRDGSGHGCGHHALGSGAIAAAAAVRQYLIETKRPGTVIYFGCPGEEGGSGKAFMARDGVFANADCAITWHPSTSNIVATTEHRANVQVKYRFTGKAAHAANAWKGRSALDAAELMNTGVQYLREHMPPSCCLHYAITNTGGLSPNVVQQDAEVLYLIRGKNSDEAAALKERVDKIARGAAMMTETKVRIEFIKACSSFLPNDVINKLLQQNAEEIARPKYTKEEYAVADEICKTYGGNDKALRSMVEKRYPPEEQKTMLKKYLGKSLYDFVTPLAKKHSAGAGSTDVGDVSHCCPTSFIYGCCFSAGAPGHSWQWVAQGKSGPAHRGMLWAAKVMAASAIDLLQNPETLKAAKDEFRNATGGKPFVSPIPKNVRPRPMK